MMKCHGGPNEVVFFVRCVFLCGLQLLHILDRSLPLSQFLTDFFTWSTKIHLQDSTRAIGDSALIVV